MNEVLNGLMENGGTGGGDKDDRVGDVTQAHFLLPPFFPPANCSPGPILECQLTGYLPQGVHVFVPLTSTAANLRVNESNSEDANIGTI